MSDEETLDPENWAELRDLGHRLMDDMIDYLSSVRERPAWQPLSAEAKTQLDQPLPVEPQGADRAYADFINYVRPYPHGTIHPRFWGWVIGTGTAFGAMADMLAAMMNPNLGGGDHGANYVEHQVLDWCKDMLGYPRESSGLLVSGGSMANLVGLTVARNTCAGFDVRQHGVAAAPRPMTVYGSVEMHSCHQKAVEVLGLGSAALRKIPVDINYQIDLVALENALAYDRAAGYQPIALIGNAGTVNTGATDDLAALADLAQREQLWFHVDGAFGALAAVSPELRPLTKGMERADSLAFDLHKWRSLNRNPACKNERNLHRQVHLQPVTLMLECRQERGSTHHMLMPKPLTNESLSALLRGYDVILSLPPAYPVGSDEPSSLEVSISKRPDLALARCREAMPTRGNKREIRIGAA